MFGDILQPTHLLFILLVALVVLGPKRLPEVAKTLGTGLRDFRQAISGEIDSHHVEPPGVETAHTPAERYQPHTEAVPLEPTPVSLEPTPAPHELALESSESAESRTEPGA